MFRFKNEISLDEFKKIIFSNNQFKRNILFWYSSSSVAMEGNGWDQTPTKVQTPLEISAKPLKCFFYIKVGYHVCIMWLYTTPKQINFVGTLLRFFELATPLYFRCYFVWNLNIVFTFYQGYETSLLKVMGKQVIPHNCVSKDRMGECSQLTRSWWAQIYHTLWESVHNSQDLDEHKYITRRFILSSVVVAVSTPGLLHSSGL